MTVQGLERFIKPDLTESEADELIAQGPDAVRWAFLEFASRLKLAQVAEGSSPGINTPSGQIPLYKKPNRESRRRKKSGAKKGHAGTRRAAPERIDEVKEHTLKTCPCCGEALGAAFEERERITEDIPEVKSVVTKHIIRRYRCTGGSDERLPDLETSRS